MDSKDINKTSVKKNMIMNAILTMSQFIFPLITFPYVSRVLFKEGTGRVDFVASVVTYFSFFAQLGIPMYGIRACGKVREDKEELSRVVHELLIINLITCLITYAVYIPVIAIVPRFQKDIPLFIIMGSTILLSAIGVEWLYRGLEKYQYITIRSLIFKAIAVVAMLLMVKTRDDYVIYGAITIFAASASNVLNFINLRKYVILKPLKGYNFRRHIKMILTFFAMSIATVIYTNLDKVMLGFMKEDADVGLYGAAVKLKNILLAVVTSASTVLLPRASLYVEKGMTDEFHRILRKTMHFIVLLAVPVTVYFILYAKEGILFLSGDDYRDAAPAMMIIMPTVFLIGITNVTGIQMLVPLGREKQVLYSEIVGAVIDLMLNAIFIPKFGAAGAAFGTFIAEIGVLIYQLYVIRDIPAKLFHEIKWIHSVVSVLIGSALCIVFKFLHFSDKVELDSFIKLAISAVLFFGAYYIYLLAVKEPLVGEITEQVLVKLHLKKNKVDI